MRGLYELARARWASLLTAEFPKPDKALPTGFGGLTSRPSAH
jgi:hypothetical protein